MFRTHPAIPRLLLGAIVAAASLTATAQPTLKGSQLPPAWAKDVVWYQIFVERFSNGNPKNDPTPATMAPSFLAPPGWRITPWVHN
ncbi:hypothetical protein [Hymenobacter jeollabukensis]|uniref:Alpha-amylase n=1 Tax=Hymenobacter jeollabukensis TaxID=2025313 RepID=A0A5R8WI75_9BACT|nr:hypothetical protein [Hymenobacter jeollabukensis]TLM87951.1 hypothetical protein FDY95_25240 [Hymenobacter jeollabukensis]